MPGRDELGVRDRLPVELEAVDQLADADADREQVEHRLEEAAEEDVPGRGGRRGSCGTAAARWPRRRSARGGARRSGEHRISPPAVRVSRRTGQHQPRDRQHQQVDDVDQASDHVEPRRGSASGSRSTPCHSGREPRRPPPATGRGWRWGRTPRRTGTSGSCRAGRPARTDSRPCSAGGERVDRRARTPARSGAATKKAPDHARRPTRRRRTAPAPRRRPREVVASRNSDEAEVRVDHVDRPQRRGDHAEVDLLPLDHAHHRVGHLADRRSASPARRPARER